jgi:single-strand DNA-binding protein
MAGINKVILVGRLGRDPEMRYTTDGRSICNFSLATSDEWKDKNTGEKKEKTEWHRVTIFGKLADVCGQYLVKGRQVYLEGKIQTRSWEADDGTTKYATDVIANEVQFLGDGTGRRQDDQQQRQIPPYAQPPQNDTRKGFQEPEMFPGQEDDIPF